MRRDQHTVRSLCPQLLRPFPSSASLWDDPLCRHLINKRSHNGSVTSMTSLVKAPTFIPRTQAVATLPSQIEKTASLPFPLDDVLSAGAHIKPHPPFTPSPVAFG